METGKIRYEAKQNVKNEHILPRSDAPEGWNGRGDWEPNPLLPYVVPTVPVSRTTMLNLKLGLGASTAGEEAAQYDEFGEDPRQRKKRLAAEAAAARVADQRRKETSVFGGKWGPTTIKG